MKLATIPPQTQSSQLLEGIDEVWQVIDCLPDENQAKGEDTARFVDRGRVKRRFNNEGVRGVRILAQDQGVRRRGRLKEIGVRACMLQEAGRTLAAANNARDLSEDVAEAATERRALVRGQPKLLLRFKANFEAGDPERIKLRQYHGPILIDALGTYQRYFSQTHRCCDIARPEGRLTLLERSANVNKKLRPQSRVIIHG